MFPLGWSAWPAIVPVLIGFLALYVPDIADKAELFRKPFPREQGLAVALAVTAVCLAYFPPRWLNALGTNFRNFSMPDKFSWWWAAFRFKEFVIGYPCLFTGLWIYFGRQDKAGSGKSVSDPRGWIFVGLLGPVGTVTVMSRTFVPFEAGLSQTVQGTVMSCLLGLVLIVSRHIRLRH